MVTTVISRILFYSYSGSFGRYRKRGFSDYIPVESEDEKFSDTEEHVDFIIETGSSSEGYKESTDSQDDDVLPVLPSKEKQKKKKSKQ